MQEIVISVKYGGYSLSKEAYKELGLVWDGFGYAEKIKRDDPGLVEMVKKLGRKADGRFANLIIVEVPDGVLWEIEEYDGQEWVSEVHRTWY